MFNGVLQVGQVIDGHRGQFLLRGLCRGILHELELGHIVEIAAELSPGRVPGIIGRNEHRVVTVLLVDEGPEAGEQVVMLIVDRVQIGNLTVHRRSLHTAQLVQLLHIITVEEVGNGVQGEVVVVERLIDVGPEVDLPVQLMDGTVAAGQIGRADPDALYVILSGTAEDHRLLIERVDALVHLP